jgi:hypothetical protein
VPSRRDESVADVERWFRAELPRFWPVGLGSLTLRRSPCINKKSCHACQAGEQHASYVLYGKRNGRRVVIYVPDRLVGEIRKAIDNGRELQKLLFEVGERYARALKREEKKKR